MTCVAAYWPGSNGVQVIRNQAGWPTTPSWVSFGTENIQIGVPARTEPNWVFDAKRMIGSKFTDEYITEFSRSWPFEIRQGENERIQIKLEGSSLGDSISPEEVSAEVLK